MFPVITFVHLKIYRVKNLLLFLSFAITTNAFCQFTLIPDQNFELALFVRGFDDILDDGQVLTANISSITYLNITYEGIADLTGIQAFTLLDTLNCSGNYLLSLDVSQNAALISLQCDNNPLPSLDVSNNLALKKLSCNRNQLTSLDVTQNTNLTGLWCKGFNATGGIGNNLTEIDVSQNTALTNLVIGGNSLTTLDVSQNLALDALICGDNLLTNLDVTNNQALTHLSCDYNQLTTLDLSQNITLEHLDCDNNQLECLNVQNGSNLNFTLQAAFDATSNPNLTCITVDDVNYSTANWTVSGDEIDPQTSFSTNCGDACTVGVSELNSEVSKKLTRIIDLTGREIQYQKNIMMLYIYDDGSSERVIEIE